MRGELIKRVGRVGGLVLATLGTLVMSSATAVNQAPVFDGRPEFAEGTDRAYYVWRDGDTWHVRWTTRGAMHRFTGSVLAEGGDIDSLEQIDVEVERRVMRPGKRSRVVVGPRGRPRVTAGRPPVVETRAQDKISKEDDRRIVFAARTDDDIDGFDFEVEDGVHSLRFLLEIAGQSRAADVEIGRANQRPDRNPFVLRLKAR